MSTLQTAAERRKPGQSAVYRDLEARCLPHIVAYHEDLTRIDRGWLEAYPGVPFLHFTRDYGTDLVGLFPADHEAWPARGETVRYLFAYADREHILRQVSGIVHYVTSDCEANRRLILHFSGTALREITADRAVELATDYVRGVQREWDRVKGGAS
jgi:hypothetical protein